VNVYYGGQLIPAGHFEQQVSTTDTLTQRHTDRHTDRQTQTQTDTHRQTHTDTPVNVTTWTSTTADS